MSPPLVLCVDFGSTFTKAVLVDTDRARVVGRAVHRTTVDTDLMDGFEACRAELALHAPQVTSATALGCSSAGGGLRIAVVGQEELVTAEAGRRVALSSGGLVVGVLSHPYGAGAWDAMAAETLPDVVLLTGGTDGGNAAPLRAAAAELAAGRWRGPVVLAGNSSVREELAATLLAAGFPVIPADNVVPRIGELSPESARAAIRQMFLAHVIGGKQLSADGRFAAMVRGATPDVVLTGVEVLAGEVGGGGVAVVDVGGATTDVHSVVPLDAETSQLRRDVVAVTPVTRTVEGDLGMRWSAPTTALAAIELGRAPEPLREAAARRRRDPGFLPEGSGEVEEDLLLAEAAITTAVRRHVGRARVVLSPEGRVVERSGKDLREVDLLVGSGGVLRSHGDAVARRLLAGATGPSAEGWQQPRSPAVVVDRECLLAAIGLLAGEEPDAAAGLARALIGAALA
ncbi:MAG: glutamate mutase L [Marmoricola sp.]